MKIIRKYFVFLFLLIGQTLFAQSGSQSVGTASVLLLRFNPAPRTSALGGAFSALGDENAIYFNPAGLSFVNSGVIAFNHTQWFEDIKIDNLLFAYKLSDKFSIAASFEYLWMPTIEGRDGNGNLTQAIDVSSSIAHISSSYKISKDFSVGLGIKYFQDKLADFSATGFGFDFGVLWNTMVSGLSVGLAAQNMGGQVSFDVEKQDIPTVYRGGIAYQLDPIDLLFSLDVIKSIDRDMDIAFGSEYVVAKQISLRLGNIYNTNSPFTPSFGIGFNIKGQYQIDYTFANYADIGSVHRAGFTFRFNKPYVYDKKEKSLEIKLVPPTNLSAKIKNNELVLSWDTVYGVQYNVYARKSQKGKWIKINKTPLYSNHLNFTKPKKSGILYFRINSIYNGKASNYSKEISINVK